MQANPLPALIHDLCLHDTPPPTTHTMQPNIRTKHMHRIIADRIASDPHDRLAHVACACVLIITTAKAKGILTCTTKNVLVLYFSSNALLSLAWALLKPSFLICCSTWQMKNWCIKQNMITYHDDYIT